MGALQLLINVFETEPNVDKRIVTKIYDQIRHKMEEQFDPVFLELSIKENAIQALHETELDLNGYDEVKWLVAKVTRYQKQLSLLVDFG